MANTFRSARLLYRAIEENTQDSAFIHSLRLDTGSRANVEPDLLKPVSEAYSAKNITRYRDEDFLGVLICLPIESSDCAQSSCLPIGRMSLKTKKGFEHHRAADIGIQIAREHQNKGYGSEAINWVLEWAFKFGNLHRVGINAMSWNPGARRLYERLGFVLEGVSREVFWFDGGWHDRVTLSMLEHEWRDRMEVKSGRERSQVGDALRVRRKAVVI